MSSWVLHYYQVFWLRGSFPILIQDAVFWTLLGVLVAANSLLEAQRSGRTSLNKVSWSLTGSIRLSVQTLAMFRFMTVLWSFWTSLSVSEWSSVVAVAGRAGFGEIFMLVLVLAGAVVVGVVLQYMVYRGWKYDRVFGTSIFRTACMTWVAVGLLLLIGVPLVHTLGGTRASEFVESLKGERMSRSDTAQVIRGYYENLLDTDTRGRAGALECSKQPCGQWGSRGLKFDLRVGCLAGYGRSPCLRTFSECGNASQGLHPNHEPMGHAR